MDAQLVQFVTLLTSPRRRAAARLQAASGAGGGAGGGDGGAGAGAALSADLAGAIGGAQSPFDLQPSVVALSPEDRLVFQRLADVPVESLRLRFAVLRMFNVRIARVISLLDVMNSSDVYSIGFKLRALGHCIFVDIKSHLLEVRAAVVLHSSTMLDVGAPWPCVVPYVDCTFSL
jgi:hypothetical protein